MINNNIEAYNLASNRGLIGTAENIKVDANGNIYINCAAPETDAELFDVIINGEIAIHQAATEVATTTEDETLKQQTKTKDGTK
jgi:hypothetical protein